VCSGDNEVATEGLPAASTRNLRGVVNLWLLLVVVWLVVNTSLDPANIVAGMAICLAIAMALPRSSTLWSDMPWAPKAAWHLVLYLGVFAREIVRANVNVLRYVYSPRIDIRPGILKVRTRLKSPIGRFILANSIALTPGTLVIAVEGEMLFVHWLDVETPDPRKATRIIIRPFERHLEQIFG
jgi:multicomponent Na+:H+ antiporter subunit E